MTQAQASRNQGPTPAQSYAAFRRATQQNQYLNQNMIFSQFGQLQTLQLPQTGYLGRIWLYFTGTITTGAGTPAGSWASYPPMPYNLIKKIRVYTSEGVEIVNISGWGLYLLNMRKESTPNMAGNVFAYLNSNTATALYQTVTPGATPAASTAYTLSGCLEVPIVTDDVMMYGLINTQTNDVRVYMDITWCNQSDTGSVSGVTLTPAFTVYPQIEFYLVPGDSAAQPVLSYVHSLYEEYFPFTTVGDIIYRPTPGNIYMSLSGIVENNGAQVAPTNINTVKVVYAQGVSPFYEQYLNNIQRLKRTIGITPPDGYFSYSFDYGNSDPTQADPRDWLNTAAQTDLQFVINVTGITPASAQLRCIREQLSRIG